MNDCDWWNLKKGITVHNLDSSLGASDRVRILEAPIFLQSQSQSTEVVFCTFSNVLVAACNRLYNAKLFSPMDMNGDSLQTAQTVEVLAQEIDVTRTDLRKREIDYQLVVHFLRKSCASQISQISVRNLSSRRMRMPISITTSKPESSDLTNI